MLLTRPAGPDAALNQLSDVYNHHPWRLPAQQGNRMRACCAVSCNSSSSFGSAPAATNPPTNQHPGRLDEPWWGTNIIMLAGRPLTSVCAAFPAGRQQQLP
jgi:hypothetical protein